MARWTKFDSFRQQAMLLDACANALQRDTESWEPLPADYQQSLRQLRDRNRRLWWAAVQAGGILVRLARTGGLDRLPRLRNAVLTRWSALASIAKSGEVPPSWYPGVPAPSLDIVLVEVFEAACRLHERRAVALRSWGKTDERAAVFIRILQTLSRKIVESILPEVEQEERDRLEREAGLERMRPLTDT